jgi:translation elongation factor EF-Ts
LEPTYKVKTRFQIFLLVKISNSRRYGAGGTLGEAVVATAASVRENIKLRRAYVVAATVGLYKLNPVVTHSLKARLVSTI